MRPLSVCALSKRSPPCHIIAEASPERNYPRSCIWNNDTHIVSQEEAQHNKLKWDTMKEKKKNPVRRFSPHRAFRFFSVPRSCVRDGGIRARLHPSRAKAVERTERERLITAASTEKNRWLCYVWENYFLTVPRSDRLRMPENKLEYKRKCVETRMFILSWALVLERRTFCVALNKKRREKQENKNFSDTKRRK